jgi:recombination protein RecT
MPHLPARSRAPPLRKDAMTDTDTTPLRQELERVSSDPATVNIIQLIERQKPEIAKALPEAIGVERFSRTVLTEIRRTPKLLECSPESLLGAMMLSAQLGLEPGPLGQVYLVPFKKAVEFVIGYRGYIDLAYRSGQVKDVAAALVREGDEFTYQYGTAPKLLHVPEGPSGEREIEAAYAVARLRTGGTVFAVIYEDDWAKAQKRSAAGSKNVGPWVEHRPAMIRKTAVRRLEPMLPKSPLFAQAIERDETPAEPLPEPGEAEGVL